MICGGSQIKHNFPLRSKKGVNRLKFHHLTNANSFFVGKSNNFYQGPVPKVTDNDLAGLAWIIGSVLLVFALVIVTICKLLLEPFHVVNNFEGHEVPKIIVSPPNNDETYGNDGKPSIEEEKEMISAQAIEEEANE